MICCFIPKVEVRLDISYFASKVYDEILIVIVNLQGVTSLTLSTPSCEGLLNDHCFFLATFSPPFSSSPSLPKVSFASVFMTTLHQA